MNVVNIFVAVTRVFLRTEQMSEVIYFQSTSEFRFTTQLTSRIVNVKTSLNGQSRSRLGLLGALLLYPFE